MRGLCQEVPSGLCSATRPGGGTGVDPALENGAPGQHSRKVESSSSAEILSLVWLWRFFFHPLGRTLPSSCRNQGETTIPALAPLVLEGQTRKMRKRAEPSPQNSLVFPRVQAKTAVRASTTHICSCPAPLTPVS